jgi:5-methylthioadenosine/S-adenosylhomocysteine deaminase
MKVLFRGGGVLRMDSQHTTIPVGYVLVEDGRITAVGPVREAPADTEVNHVEDVSGCWVVPGLINMHQHHWYQLLKGISPGLYLEEWVDEILRPASEALTLDDFLVSMRLAAADMLTTGTTTFFNHSVVETPAAWVDDLATVSVGTGIRQVLGKEVRATTRRTPPDEHRVHIERLLRDYPMRADSLFGVALAIETGEHWLRSGTMTEELAAYVTRLVAEFDVPVSDHVTGGTSFRSVADFRRRTGSGEVEWLARRGLLTQRMLLAHAVWITDDEVLSATASGATVVTCPSSSAFTAGGVPPVRSWLASGLNVAVGTDGPMVNDSLDMLGQLRECFLLQNVKYLTPAAVPIDTLWAMATRNGAKALGMDGQLGEITPGASADLAVFDLDDPRYGGALNPPANLVLSGGQREARTVMVRGEIVKDAGGLRTIDVPEALRESRERARELVARAGLRVDRAGTQSP